MQLSRISTLVLTAALVAACSDAPSPTDTGNQIRPNFDKKANSTSFSESFESGKLSPNGKLETVNNAVAWTKGYVTFNGQNEVDRSFLRTVAGDYQDTNFTADVTITVPGGFGGTGIGFIGLGAGTTGGCYYFCEPAGAPAVYARVMPDDFNPGVQITTVDANSSVNEGARSYDAGSGTDRVRITWDAATRAFTVAIQRNYVDGGPFVPTAVVGPEYMPAGSFTSGTAHIFIGGAGNVSFHDLKVVAQSAK